MPIECRSIIHDRPPQRSVQIVMIIIIIVIIIIVIVVIKMVNNLLGYLDGVRRFSARRSGAVFIDRSGGLLENHDLRKRRRNNAFHLHWLNVL